MSEEVFVVVLLGSSVFVAWVDLYVNVIGGIRRGIGGDVYFLNNRLWLKDGLRVGKNSCKGKVPCPLQPQRKKKPHQIFRQAFFSLADNPFFQLHLLF